MSDDLKHNPDSGPSISHDYGCTHDPCRCPRPDDLAAVHPKPVRIVRQAIRHLFPLPGDGDATDGWSDAYAVVTALADADLLADPAPEGLSEEDADVCAICGDIYCDGVGCYANLDADDPRDHARIEQVQGWVRRGRRLTSTEEGTDG